MDLSGLERDRTHDLWVDLEDGSGQLHLLVSISGLTRVEPILDLSSFAEPSVRTRWPSYDWKHSLSDLNFNEVGYLAVKVYCAKGELWV